MSDERKHTLTVITFPGHDTADKAYDDLHHADDVKIKTAAVVTRKDSGKLKLKHKRRITFWKGVLGGGAIGALLAMALGGPIGAVAGGAALVGGLIGTTRHNERQHLKEYLDDKLGQNDSALGIEFSDDTNWATIEGIVEKYNGDYLKVELTPAAKEALDNMTSDEEAGKAVSQTVESEDDPNVEVVDSTDDSSDGGDGGDGSADDSSDGGDGGDGSADDSSDGGDGGDGSADDSSDKGDGGTAQ